MKRLLQALLALSVWMFSACLQARQEEAFTSLSNLVKEADYIVIVSIKQKSTETFMDGWVKYGCRFVYWLKIPDAAKLKQSEQLKASTGSVEKAEVQPYPLWKVDSGDQNIPEGLPRTNSVILVDTHEKPYNKLIPGEDTMKLLSADKRCNTYHLLFLRKGEQGQPYVTIGCENSILPVSPDLDIRRLPPEPHQERESNDCAPVNMTLEDTVSFILKDFIRYKEKELTVVKEDLRNVLDKK